MLKEGRAKAVRFTTLAALCEVLECRPGDLLRWEAEDGADAMGAVGGGPVSQPLPDREDVPVGR